MDGLRKFRSIGSLVALILMVGCQFPFAPQGAAETGFRLTLSLTQPSLASSGARLLLSNATKVTVELFSEGTLVEEKTVSRVGTQATVEFALTPLKAYQIKATAKDEGGTALFYGETTVTLKASEKGTLNLLPVASPVASLKATDQAVGSGLGSLAALPPGAMANYRIDFGSTASQFTFAPFPTEVLPYVQNPDGTPIALSSDRILRRTDLKTGSLAWVTFHNPGNLVASAMTTLGTFTIPVTSVTLTGPTTLTWGEEGDLKLSPIPANATAQAVSDFEFISLDPTVATVDAAGHFVAQSQDGSTSIVVKWKGDLSKTFVHLVTSAQVPLTALTLSQGMSANLATGSTLALTATPVPANATNKAVTWASSDPTRASVDPASGVVTALLPGVATITATSVAFPSVKATIDLTLTPTLFTVFSAPALSLPAAPAQTVALAGTVDQLWALGSDRSVRQFSAGLWEAANRPLVPSVEPRWLAVASGVLYVASATEVHQFSGTGTWESLPVPSGLMGLAAVEGALWASSSDGFLWSWQGSVWQKVTALPPGFVALGGGEGLVALVGTQVLHFNGSTWDPVATAPAQAASVTFAYQSILILVVR